MARTPLADEVYETLKWLRYNYASGSTAEINARIESAIRRIEDDADYDGPPDGEAWSGGFAENH